MIHLVIDYTCFFQVNTHAEFLGFEPFARSEINTMSCAFDLSTMGQDSEPCSMTILSC